MIAEQQYYQAKTFLTTLRDAHSTLEYPINNPVKLQQIGHPFKSIKLTKSSFLHQSKMPRFHVYYSGSS